MNFTWLSAGAFVGGLAALAAALFAMQRLRVRHREVTVATSLFWREAVEDTRARVFRQRFRHPWAYVLLLSIAALLWLAVAGPLAPSSTERAHVLVLDASAGMARAHRFESALIALRERARDLPRASTTVLAAGAHVRTLLAPGEEPRILDERATALAPEACPGSFDRALLGIAEIESPGVDVELFGTAPVSNAAVERLGAGATVVRAPFEPGNELNSGLTALGASPAASGAWDAVDVFAEVWTDPTPDAIVGARGPGSPTTTPAFATADIPRPTIRLGATALASFETKTVETSRGRALRVIARDVPARGGRIEASVGDDAGGTSRDALTLDDRAALVLPERPSIRVALSAAVPASVRAGLAADPGIVLVEHTGTDAVAADIVVRAAGEDFGASLPALELADDAAQGSAFVVRAPRSADAERTLRAAFVEIGLDEIDSTELATAAARPIEVALEEADARSISLWAVLCSSRFDFARTRSFPLFLGRAVRWLANVPAFTGDLAAGELRLGSTDAWTDEHGARRDAIGAETRIPRAGDVRFEDGRIAHAALLDDATTAPNAGLDDASGVHSELARIATVFDPLPWVVLLALCLLLVEGWLVRTERIP